MNHHGFRRVGGWLSLVAAMTAGCTQAPDLAAARAEAAKPVQRHDVIQALASRGDVVAAGTNSGVILASHDGGQTWTRQSIASPSSLIGMDVCPDGSFIAIDFYRRLWSADADLAAWTAHPLAQPRTALTVHCDGQGRWWVAGSRAVIARSDDHGANWTTTDLQDDLQITTLQMVDAQNGFATGEFGTVLVTTDGGTSWARRGALPGEFYPYAALFASPAEGWVSGLAGQVLHTTDGGETWTAQIHRGGAPLFRMFMHEGTPHAVGAGGSLVRLQGDEWVPLAHDGASPVFLSAATSLGARHSIIVGGPGGLLRSLSTGSTPTPGGAQ
jgi:photosystem II stability/assembly factor-like uncharacterized protein